MPGAQHRSERLGTKERVRRLSCGGLGGRAEPRAPNVVECQLARHQESHPEVGERGSAGPNNELISHTCAGRAGSGPASIGFFWGGGGEQHVDRKQQRCYSQQNKADNL
jgi:hypothetical protein